MLLVYPHFIAELQRNNQFVYKYVSNLHELVYTLLRLCRGAHWCVRP
jgi:hypothetical protein